jgi:hypothetical protein
MGQQLILLQLLHHDRKRIGALEQSRANPPFSAEAGEGRSARNPATRRTRNETSGGGTLRRGWEPYVMGRKALMTRAYVLPFAREKALAHASTGGSC